MKDLIEAVERFCDSEGVWLEASPEWHALKAKINEVLAYAIEADKAMKLLMERVQS